MERLVGFVFKFIGLSLIFMLTLDTSFIIVDTINVHSRMMSISNMMQNEIARNNCIPNASAGLFNTQINQVVENSVVATAYTTNIDTSSTVNGNVYAPINESNVKDYGEIQTLAMNVTMNPATLYFANNTVKGLQRIQSDVTYNLSYVYPVPCLRYLK